MRAKRHAWTTDTRDRDLAEEFSTSETGILAGVELRPSD